MSWTGKYVGVAVGALLRAPALAGTVAPDDVAFIDESSVAGSLTGTSGNAENGRKVFANRKFGNCLACHANGDLAGELCAIMVNSKIVFGDQTIMPSFYRLKDGARTADKFQGKTILTAEQVEDVIAYLQTLKE